MKQLGLSKSGEKQIILSPEASRAIKDCQMKIARAKTTRQMEQAVAQLTSVLCPDEKEQARAYYDSESDEESTVGNEYGSFY